MYNINNVYTVYLINFDVILMDKNIFNHYNFHCHYGVLMRQRNNLSNLSNFRIRQ